MEKQSSEELISKDFVFAPDDSSGRLKFVGDFEGLYSSEDDPWGQSGADTRMGGYYAHSRSHLLKVLLSLPLPATPNMLEVGCGLGYVANMLHQGIANSKVSGMDISGLAIEKAAARFADIEFVVGDITSKKLAIEKRFDVIIVNQVLWYVLEGLAELFDNVEKLLVNGGIVVIVNAFLDDQKYGKEIIDGFDGLVKYAAMNLLGKRFSMIKAELDCASAFLYKDGLLALKKC